MTAKPPGDGTTGDGGRTSKYRKEYVAQARRLARIGATDNEIAQFFEVSGPTIIRWCAQHPAFRKAIDEITPNNDNRVRRALFRKACAGDVAAIQFWLKNRKPAEWREKQEITTTKQISVIHRVIVDPDPKVIEGGEAEVIEHDEGEDHETGPNVTHSLPKRVDA